MSIATRIENMSNNIKNAYDSLDDLGLDLDGVDKNLENLSSQIDLIYNELPQVEDSGTEITLEPTKSAKMVLKLNGNSYQKQYTGKNYLNTYAQVSTSAFGIDISVDKDGIITLNGTSTKDNNGINLNQTITGDGEQYTLKAEIISGTYTKPSNESRFNFHVLSSGHSYSGPSQQFGESTSATATLTNNYEYDTIGFRVDLGVALNNLKIKVQLEKNSSATDYEPYVGKQPSPSINYPQTIQVVNGDNTIECIGENMWDVSNYNNITINTNGSPSNVEKGINNISFTSNENNTYCGVYINNNVYQKHIINFENTKTYVLSFDVNVNKDTTIQYGIDTPKITTEITAGTHRLSVVTTANTGSFSFYNRYASEVNFIISNIKITEQDKSTSLEYKPFYYNQYSMNLWDSNIFNSATMTPVETGKYIDKDGNYSSNNEFSVYKSNIKPNLLYKIVNSGMSTAPGVAIYDENDNYIDGFKYDQKPILTYKMPIGAKYILYSVVTSSTSPRYDENTYSIQEELELCKIGNYQDYFYKENNNWYKYKKINKVILDGSEDWGLQSINSYGIANFNKNIADYLSTEPNQTYTNLFSPQTSLIANTKIQGYYLNTNKTLYIRINSNIASTVENFKTWLSSNNIILYYVLATPVLEQINDVNLISQLNATTKAKSFDSQTNLLQKNADLPFIIEATALKKNS